jgi:hypothetical protein
VPEPEVTFIRHIFCNEFLKRGFRAGLRFGGNDVGSVMLEENVVTAAGRKQLHHRRRATPYHPRCGIQACAERYAVSAVFPELGITL